MYIAVRSFNSISQWLDAQFSGRLSRVLSLLSPSQASPVEHTPDLPNLAVLEAIEDMFMEALLLLRIWSEGELDPHGKITGGSVLGILVTVNNELLDLEVEIWKGSLAIDHYLSILGDGHGR